MLPNSIQQTLSPARSDLTELIIVPGHAIFVGKDPVMDRYSTSDWILEPYQASYPRQSIQTFLNHIHKAIYHTLSRPQALLVYSGGQTRQAASELTEASSYSRLANLLDLYNSTTQEIQTSHPDSGSTGSQSQANPFPRMTTEEFALDSWSNLLFSVARFKE